MLKEILEKNLIEDKFYDWFDSRDAFKLHKKYIMNLQKSLDSVNSGGEIFDDIVKLYSDSEIDKLMSDIEKMKKGVTVKFELKQ